MRFYFTVLAFLGMFALSQQSLADEPPPLRSPPETAATPAAPNSPTEFAKTHDRDAQDKRMRALGYKPEVHDGKTLYCRWERPLDTHFEKKFCSMSQDLDRMAARAREGLERVQHPKNN
jgi:hypothetical protein